MKPDASPLSPDGQVEGDPPSPRQRVRFGGATFVARMVRSPILRGGDLLAYFLAAPAWSARAEAIQVLLGMPVAVVFAVVGAVAGSRA